MKQLVINVKDNKLSFFLELIRNFDFITVEDNADWYSSLSVSQKQSIEKGLEDLRNGKTRTNAEVMDSVKTKIQSLKDR
ncbi:hypothetical protein Q765_18480 [Flavobacterium rivuli WB 3.3-2 = DSM 21788]|uniref:Uncharacterized protein n=1 Tax=Flavobacterium rivuli WB 3.3-2 = DSM 21788 TaxID=1121895 RepID=A0A0A2LX95_9FLAO|nr:hypothetical protein [Flavobacterium rivuli]KGO85002.1 hypothetical protein Q765_18480 [Flavobacterium rivuli WB 3.3-2 = DSM 21788]